MKKNIKRKLQQEIKLHNINQYNVISDKLGIVESHKNLTYLKLFPVICSFLLSILTYSFIAMSLNIEMVMTPEGEKSGSFLYTDLFRTGIGILFIVSLIALLYFTIRFIQYMKRRKKKKGERQK